jgi:anti-anti-sigma factor
MQAHDPNVRFGRPDLLSEHLFEVWIDWEGRRALIGVRGEVDCATAPTLDEAVETALHKDPCKIIFDLHQVGFLDTEGIKVIVKAHRALLEKDGSISVRGCRRPVARIFHVLGLHQIFTVAEYEAPDSA